jgi:hypothetical protein
MMINSKDRINHAIRDKCIPVLNHPNGGFIFRKWRQVHVINDKVTFTKEGYA